MNKFYIYTFLMTVVAVGSITFTACSVVPVIEHPNRANVLAENFTSEAKALNHELDTFDELMPMYPDDSEQVLLEAAIKDFVQKDATVSKEKLEVATMDLQLFEGDQSDIYFAAVMQNKEKVPFTLLAQMKSVENNHFKVLRSCLAPYYANLPKTFLLKEDNDIALVSQRPFSTFEEVYFYKLTGGELNLNSRGWQDISLAYYTEVNQLLDRDELDQAMNLPDESMYPMAYEEMLFTTANKMIDKTLVASKDERIDPQKRADWLEWAINYYTQNHYGQSLEDMLDNHFEALMSSEGVFGSDYLISQEIFKSALVAYANLKAKTGDESLAESLLKASETLPVKK